MIIEDYIEYQDKYVNQFGSKTIVLMEVGGFFEYYYINNKETNEIWNFKLVRKVCEVLDSVCSLKNNKRPHYMGGFPNHSIHKHLSKLLNSGFTVITIVQESHGENNPERNVSGIYSPGTNIEYNLNYDSNYLCCICIEEYSFNQNKLGYSIGLALTDLSTGTAKLFETNSNLNDINYPLDEI